MAKKVKEPKPYEKYKHIAAWGKMLSSNDSYIRGEQKRALAEKAPDDSCFYNQTLSKWVAYSELNAEAKGALRIYLAKV